MKHARSILPPLAVFTILALHAGCAAADDAGTAGSPLLAPIIDVRLRSETVSQSGMSEDAEALTLRGRFGFETRPWRATSLLAEGEFVRALQEDYDSTVNGKSQFPTVADPRADEVNRLHVTNTALPGTRVVIGRQRIALDDQRFVGSVGWRQNEQTFDAVRVVNTSLPKLTIDATYLDQVNRINGPESPVGRWHGNSYLASIAGKLPIGTLTAFATLLEFEEAAAESSDTRGLRFNAQHASGPLKWGIAASYAIQRDHANNPLDYEAEYRALAATSAVAGWSFELGIEQLGSDGSRGFSTPLATLHRFQGWADKFLATPPSGIDDRYLTAGYARAGMPGVQKLAATGSYHVFAAERGHADYGDEIDLQVRAEWKHVRLGLKFAEYAAEGFATETTKWWVDLEYVW